METQKRDNRKVLLLLPLLVTPLLALGFYAMGGGKGDDGSAALPKGINASLPDASFKKADPVDKMGFYAKGGADSAEAGNSDKLARELRESSGSAAADRTAEIDAKLALLQKEISASPVEGSGGKGVASSQGPKHKMDNGGGDGGMKSEVDRLELLMRSMKADSARDPEMDQMNGLLEKIMDIQHPARVEQRAAQQSHGPGAEAAFRAVPAELADNCKVVQGSTIRLRLLDSVVLKNVMVPKGHFVFGQCRIINQRLLLEIKTVRLGEMIIPVNLTLYGMDGMAGLCAPDAVLSAAAAGGAADAVSGISVYGMEGIGGQVAGAGIDAAKSLFSNKIKVVRVRLKAGERVLLRLN